jgi:GNAT superfamily N-acetyltransferase
MADDVTGGDFSYDRAALDAVERLFWRELWQSAAPDAIEERGIQIETFGPIQATVVADLPEHQMMNLVLGADEAGAVEGGHLAEAIEWVDSLGVDYYVPLTPGAPGALSAEDWLNRRGFERASRWIKFVRDSSPPALPTPPGVQVFEVEKDEGEGLAGIAARGFGLPPWAGTFFFDLAGRPGWRCYVAVVDGDSQACGAMFIHDGVAEFGVAATLESARGRGCQTALLQRRIVDAIEAGCGAMFVEAGERPPDPPAIAYRSMVRAGFRAAYLRPNWQPPRS